MIGTRSVATQIDTMARRLADLEIPPLPGYPVPMRSLFARLSSKVRLIAWRAVFAVAISAALVLSLTQMPCGDSMLADGPATIETALSDAGTSPHQTPSHQRAAHCDHCLVHVAFQPFATLAEGRVEFASVKVTLPNDAAPVSVAGLPLFKPPRA